MSATTHAASPTFSERHEEATATRLFSAVACNCRDRVDTLDRVVGNDAVGGVSGTRDEEAGSVTLEPPLAPGGAIRTPQGGEPATSKNREGSTASEQGSRVDGGVRHVHVTIGRVEVRAVAPEPAARMAAPKRPAALSLDEYLRKRGQP